MFLSYGLASKVINAGYLIRSVHLTMAQYQMQNFVKDGKKILGAALNFRDMVKPGGAPVPENPILFLKPSSSYIQEGEDIVIPKYFTKVAHEVELGVIIGKQCKNVSKEHAMCYVGGYCLALDLTAQCELGIARQKGLPWSIGKGFDTATPVSRFIAPSELEDPHNVQLWCKINGEIKQKGNTSDLIFRIPDLIEYASKYMTLEVNDLILTGTPGGAAPMAPGDSVECGLGEIVSFKFQVKSFN